MSLVSGWTLICEMVESDDPDSLTPGTILAAELNAVLARHGHPESFAPVQEHYLGSKHPQVLCFGAGLNHADIHPLAKALLGCREWDSPDRVLLVVHAEEGWDVLLFAPGLAPGRVGVWSQA